MKSIGKEMWDAKQAFRDGAPYPSVQHGAGGIIQWGHMGFYEVMRITEEQSGRKFPE